MRINRHAGLGGQIHDVRRKIRECWERSDSGHGYAAALAGEGLTLAQGKRRDFMVIDREGGIHALGKRILGSTASEVRARCVDLDRESLPTVVARIETPVIIRAACANPKHMPAGNTGQCGMELMAILAMVAT